MDATQMVMSSVGSPLPDVVAEKEEGPCGARTLWTRLWHGLAGASLIVNIVSMAIEASAASFIAGIIAVLVAPVVIVRQLKLQSTDTLRQVLNNLRHDCNKLQVENNKMHFEVNKMEAQVGELKTQEQKLDAITKEQGSNVDTLVELVKENRQITDEMKLVVRSDTMQILVQAIVSSDFDSNSNFSDQEIQIMEIRLANIPGVEVNKSAFRKALHESDRTVEAVVAFVKHLFREDLPVEERIFQLKPEQ